MTQDQPSSWSPFSTASFAQGQGNSTIDQISSKTSEAVQRRWRRDDIYPGRAVCPVAGFTCTAEMPLKTLQCAFFPSSSCMISVMVNNIGEVFTQFVNYFLSCKTWQHESQLVWGKKLFKLKTNIQVEPRRSHRNIADQNKYSKWKIISLLINYSPRKQLFSCYIFEMLK